MNEIDFQKLCAPPSALNIKHDQNYVFHYQGKKPMRSVFNDVIYEEVEEKIIQRVECEILKQKLQLPENWNQSDTLRFCYTGDFEIEKTINNIKLHLIWREDPIWHNLNADAENYLKNGTIYYFGKDYLYRPIVYIQIAQVSSDMNKLQGFLTALCYLLDKVKQYMFVPYYVERMRIILDTANVSLFKLPIKVIRKIIEVTQLNYNGTLESLYLLDPPFIFIAAAKIIGGFIHPDTNSRIKLLAKPEFSLMNKAIPIENLQQKHGGLHPNLDHFWPIKTQEIAEHTIYFTINEDSNQHQIYYQAPIESSCQCFIM